MKYVRVPRELQSRDLRQTEVCLSPGRYVRFIPPSHFNASQYAALDKLVVVREETIKVQRGDLYQYAEIGDINVATGGVIFNEMRGFQLPTQRPALAQTGDVLVSTVRTYRKGIGLVTETAGSLVTTNAVLNICGVTGAAPGVTLPYVYSFLRSDFFVEQVWALLNRGVYPRMDTGALDKIMIPVASDPKVCGYVGALAQAIADKEAAIRARHKAILRMIDEELSSEQASKPFRYEHPHSNDVRETYRLDTGLYCEGFRAFRHRVTSYKHGTTKLSQMGVRSRRGPNLAVSIIGHSLYSNTEKPGWYELIRPVNISEYGTLSTREWLGSPKTLQVVKPGEIVLGCEGFEKGRSLVLIEAPTRCTTNFHGVVLSWPGAKIWDVVFLRCFLAYLRQQGVIDWVGVGGSGGHMSPEYFDFLPFPKFAEAFRRAVAELYHSSGQPTSPKIAKLEDFVSAHHAWNAKAGVWELDREMKRLQLALSYIQEKIIRGERIDLPF